MDQAAPAPFMTAEEMLSRNIVPIKAQFLVRKAAPPKQEPGTTATKGDAAQPGPAGEDAAERGAAKGREQEQQSKSKSRKQMRKDVRDGRPAELCTNFALGRCTFGERCRFSHDLAEYLRAKPADLPGSCPWAAARLACPYGITCRYARSHGSNDDHHKLLASIPPPPAEAEAPADGAPAASAAAAAADGTDGVGAAAAGGDGTTAAAAAPPSSDVPVGPLALPPPASIEAVVNSLDKEVQAQLWKSRYDFSTADGILSSMGLRISFKQQPKPLPGGGDGRSGGRGGGRGGGGRGGGRGKGGRGDAVPEATAAEDGAPVEDSTLAELGAAQGADAAGPSEAQPGVNAEVKAKNAGELAAAGPASDAMQVDQAQPSASSAPSAAAAAASDDGGGGGSGGGGEGDGGAAAAGTSEAKAAHEPAAKRQRTDGGGGGGSSGSDAAAIAALAAEQEAADAAAAPSASEAAAAERRAEARAAHVEVAVRPAEKRRLDFRGKTYLAPLTTVGNLPFRRICKALGVDVTCGEMALATNLLQGQASEWALLKRHPSEDCFGVQVCGGYPDALARVGQLLGERISADFVDINMGCPIDLVCDKNAGSALLRQPRRIEQIVRATSGALGETPLTFKTRKGYNDGEDVAHTFLPRAGEWGAAAVTLHGRTRQQRYSKLADWEYVKSCGSACAEKGLQLVGNGDVFSYTDWNTHMEESGGGLASIMIGRGALIKPWIFTEIKEQRHWDISASERLDLYRQFCAAGLEHWGSDGRGVETTRRFLLEWLSFTHRYVPVGLLEVLPQRMNHRPPAFVGRSELETLLASEEPQDWIRISEMLLGRPPAPLSFAPKHKSNAYGPPGAASELDMARG